MNNRAFSLLEVLVVCGLAALLSVFLIRLLIGVLSVVGRTRSQNEIQQESQIFITRLSSQVQQCDAGGVTAIQEPHLVALGLHPMHDVDPRGRKIYAPQLLLLNWKPTTLEIRETASDPMPSDNCWQPIKLGPDAMENMADSLPHRRVLLRQVTLFEASASPLKVVFEVRGESNAKLRVERYLSLRNVF